MIYREYWLDETGAVRPDSPALRQCAECELVKEAAKDESLSDLAARIAIQGIVDPEQPTQADVAWAREALMKGV